MDRCKNFFALGMCYWLYNRSMDATLRWLEDKFKSKPQLVQANRLAMQAGYSYCEATEAFQISYEIPPAKLAPGALSQHQRQRRARHGFRRRLAKSRASRFSSARIPSRPHRTFSTSFPQYKDFGVITFQAEDEIAAITSAIGAAYAGALGITTTSGPGMALKTEALGLAVAVELPLVICDIQRGGPSTGLPTKTEQADLLASSLRTKLRSADSRARAFYAGRLLLDRARSQPHRHQIHGSGHHSFRRLSGQRRRALENSRLSPSCRKSPCISKPIPEDFHPYRRNPETLARPWAIPGTPGLEHRVGGLEKQDVTGNVNYEPLNHERMVRLRAEKVAGIVPGRSRCRSRRRSFRRSADRRLGLHARPDHRRAESQRAKGPAASATFICAI